MEACEHTIERKRASRDMANEARFPRRDLIGGNAKCARATRKVPAIGPRVFDLWSLLPKLLYDQTRGLALRHGANGEEQS